MLLSKLVSNIYPVQDVNSGCLLVTSHIAILRYFEVWKTDIMLDSLQSHIVTHVGGR